MFLIDTHAHLYDEVFDGDRQLMLQRAKAVGVSAIVLPNVDSQSMGLLKNLVDAYPELCFPAAGLHPCSVNKNFREELTKVEQELASKKYFAVGETGLDFYWDTTFAEEQKISFRVQIEWASAMNLPLIIHTRNSFDSAYEIIAEYKGLVGGIFHCFSGSVEDAQKIISLGGFKMGIGGSVTYKNSTLPHVISEIPLEHLVLETDAPYLPPVPHRGKRNETSYIAIVGQKLAEIKSVSFDEIVRQTTLNAREIFNFPF